MTRKQYLVIAFGILEAAKMGSESYIIQAKRGLTWDLPDPAVVASPTANALSEP